MAYNNFGYTGYIPSNVSVQDNINQALQYQATHSPIETLEWFKSMVQNHGEWDYKQQSSDYENFGNFNYGAVGSALGYPDAILKSAAGGAQLTSLNGGDFEKWAALDFLEGLLPWKDFGSNDDPNDQAWINEGIDAAEKFGYDPFSDSQTTRPDFPNNHDFNDTDEGYDLGFTRPAPNSGVNDNWNDGKNWTPPPVDPLVLDLDGDGIETLGVNATTHVVFDYDGDGLKTGTGWVSGDDGFLVLDRNGNGTIDNGGELFGDQTLVNGVKAANGLEALKAEDTNMDGVFDANDTNYTNVRVWQDTNSDGISQSSELHTLTELGIASINLTSSTSTTTTNGNTQTATGTFTRNDGTTGTAANLNFAQNPFYREFTDHLTLTDTAKTLPDMQGSGMVRVNNREFENRRSVA